MSDELWGWVSSEDSEEVEGPFDSREAAVEFGKRHEDGPGLVARCSYIRPEEWVTSGRLFDLDELLEQMEENLSDAGWGGFDDPTFEVKPGLQVEAQDDLVMILKVWAEKYLTAQGRFTVRGEYEEP